MNTNISLICFKSISDFIVELTSLFGEEQRSLKLYNRLINKTTLTHTVSIYKHIETFKTFCVENRDAIYSKNSTLFKNPIISYSQKVYINITDIFNIADKETSTSIWDHLLCISALVDPAGKAKDILRDNVKEGNSSSIESDFLSTIIDKVEQHVNPESNPMEAVSSILQSGVFTDLISGMNQGLSDGSLDIAKLMGAVQGMVGKISDKTDNDPSINNSMNMLTTLMGNMNKIQH